VRKGTCIFHIIENNIIIVPINRDWLIQKQEAHINHKNEPQSDSKQFNKKDVYVNNNDQNAEKYL